MKKLLLNLIVVLSRDLAAVQVRIQCNKCFKGAYHKYSLYSIIAHVCDFVQLFKESHVMLALMQLVQPSYSESRCSGKARRSWTAVQQEELQLQALATMATVAPLMLEEYMVCQANTYLLMLLDWCTQQGSR